MVRSCGLDDGRVVSNFICQSLLGRDLTIFGDGSQTRSFCFVTDMIDGFVRLMNSSDTVTGPINLGNPNEFSVRELAEKIIAATGSKSNIVERPLPQDDPKQRQPDITQAREALGWQPSISLEQGLTLTIAYFETLLRERGVKAIGWTGNAAQLF